MLKLLKKFKSGLIISEWLNDALDIAQEYICKLPVYKVNEQITYRITKTGGSQGWWRCFKISKFWINFEATVHDNDNTCCSEIYLSTFSTWRGCLHTIEGFEVTSANYHHAVDTLKHRFGRKRIITLPLVKSIIVQLQPRINTRAASLRDLHNTVKNLIRALPGGPGWKPNDPLYSCILLPILETKLPPELSEKWKLELTDIKEEHVNLGLFFKFLKKQVISKEARERNASMIGEDGETVRGKGGQDKDRTGVKNTRGNIYFQQLLYWQVGRIRVIMQHAVCVTIRDMKQRVSRRTLAVRENRMCFNCLRPANTFHYSSVCHQPKCSV